jgi:hypothetical protein
MAVPESKGHYPLHLAYKNQCSEPVLRLLIKHYPMAIQRCMKGNQNLLHKICKQSKNKEEEQQQQYSESFITFLINQCPIAAQQKDADGHYPLYYAFMSKQPESILKLLIDAYPLALQEKIPDGDGGGYLLHEACKNSNTSESFMDLIIDTYPSALQETNHEGQYPLDIVYRYNQPESIICLIINKYPIMEENKDLAEFE